MTIDKAQALGKSALFELLSSAELDVLGHLARPVRFAPGERVVHEGEVGGALYVLASGQVEVLRRAADGAEKVLAVLEAPAAFGEMSLIDREQRGATVRARSDCVALELAAEDLASFRKHSRDGFTLVVVNIARLLSSRLREANARLAERL
ncbi:MAG TPA: cyclic nucleotide-binding domain-containing protein [Anaeromyxobacteraceae bacterium]|nr:cyclic nucleotide-binding domain-containing protein [Anaeromyxobacteraceae bacterium]